MKRVAANDPASIICALADSYKQGTVGVQQDHDKAMELYKRSAELG
jgi:TPR repeat protein